MSMLGSLGRRQVYQCSWWLCEARHYCILPDIASLSVTQFVLWQWLKSKSNPLSSANKLNCWAVKKYYNQYCSYNEVKECKKTKKSNQLLNPIVSDRHKLSHVVCTWVCVCVGRGGWLFVTCANVHCTCTIFMHICVHVHNIPAHKTQLVIMIIMLMDCHHHTKLISEQYHVYKCAKISSPCSAYGL